MADPEYRPEWEVWSSGEEDVEDRVRRPPKRARRERSNTPDPEGDFDWRSHYEEMKNKTIEPFPGIARPPIRIAAFNIQIFGAKKMKRKDVTSVLVKILQRYDLILIQEIRDSSETALDRLVKMVSQVEPDDPYATVVSERLGRTNSKEQYAFMFRKSRISVADTYQFDDGEDNGSDAFQREPFAVKLYSPYLEVPEFGIIAIHTQPDRAVQEVNALAKVYEATKRRWKLPDIMIAGDFNADEGYIDRDDWSKIALRNDRRFKWMIGDEVDTTVGNTDRAYDRFVVAGKRLTKAVVAGSSRAYKFDEALGLSADEAEDVSDHYPIEIEFKGAANLELQSELSTNISVTIRQKSPIAGDSESILQDIHKTPSNTKRSAYFSHEAAYDDRNRVCRVTAFRGGVSDVIESLKDFRSAFPGLVSDDTVAMARAYLESSAVLKPQPLVYGLVYRNGVGYGGGGGGGGGGNGGGDGSGGGHGLDVEIEIKGTHRPLCSVTISRPMS